MMPEIVFASNELTTYSILGISFFLLFLAIFFIYRQKNNKSLTFLFFRLFSYIIAIISLALAGLQPQIQTSLIVEKSAIVLNNPNNLDSLAQIVANSKTSPTFFSIQTAHQKTNNSFTDSLQGFEIRPIPNLSYLAKQKETNSKFSSLLLIGDGLETHELGLLDSFPQVHLRPNALPHGIHNIAWQRHLQVGETLLLQGKFYHENAKQAYKMVLKGFGQTLDSIFILPKKNIAFSSFQLQHNSKQAGKQVFQLLVKNESDETISQNDIPFISQKQNINNILILSSEPSFEIKFLKNFLAKNNFGVAVRQKISREIFKTDFLNLDTEKDLNNLSYRLLNSFDCLILDIATLKNLSAAETKNLQNACQNQGLSVLLLLNDSFVKEAFSYTNFLAKHNLFKGFELEKNSLFTQTKIALQETEKPANYILNAINLKYYIAAKAKQKAVFQTTEKQAVLAFQQLGLGKISISSVPKTYLWPLSGDETNYEKFWHTALENLFINFANSSDFVLKEQLPIVDFPLHFRYQNKLKNDVVVWQNTAGENFELASSELIDQTAFVGKFWPKQVGWHRLFLKNKTSEKLDFYVYPHTNWNTYNIAKKTKKTHSYLVDNQSFAKGSLKSILEEEKLRVIPLFWFYIAFFISISALWISEKFNT